MSRYSILLKICVTTMSKKATKHVVMQSFHSHYIIHYTLKSICIIFALAGANGIGNHRGYLSHSSAKGAGCNRMDS
jgi:hypothetical protein